MDHSNVRVYAKHLQAPSVVHQACIGDWTRHQGDVQGEVDTQESAQVDVVFGKGSFLSLYRFVADGAVLEERPTGSLNLIHEQAVFGTIKDVKTLTCTLEPEHEDALGTEMEADEQSDRPRLGYLPRNASMTVLVATSDSGILSFLTFSYKEDDQCTAGHGRFHILKEIEIAEPGFDYMQAGAKIAVDPSSRIMAVSALQNHIKLVIIRSTKRSNFDPVERISDIDLKGTIVGMDFLTPDSEDLAILAVLFHNKETSKYHLATFHIGLHNRLTGPLSIQVGTSQLGSNSQKSVVLIKALPNIPCSLVYVDEEKITLVTVETPTGPRVADTARHTTRSSLQLLKRERSEKLGELLAGPLASDTFPLISACATPPSSPFPSSDQTLYLGSDTSELYRVNIQYLTYTMQFELISGDRPIGDVMQVLVRRQFATEPLLSDMDQEIVLNTDYLIYSSDYGDGGILAIKEEEDSIDLFAITELQNNSPILDFCVREPSHPGRDSLYVCSGMKDEGCLKRIRSGISVESSGSSGNEFFAGATGLWSVKENLKDAFDSFLVVSFMQSTKFMRSGDGGSLEDISGSCGFDLAQATVHAGRLRDGVIFQVHRSGVIATYSATGERHSWHCDDGVLTSACLISEGTLILGQISAGSSMLIMLELTSEGSIGDQDFAMNTFKVLASKDLKAEPTTINCWRQSSDTDSPGTEDDTLFCIGTLEPAVLVFQIKTSEIFELYSESLAQAGLESVAIPHSICLLRSRQGRFKILVGLRDGGIIAYDWTKFQEQRDLSVPAPARPMSSPRLYKLGILPVKFALSDTPTLSNALVLSDKLWLASYNQGFEILPILFDSEVSQACSFQSNDEEQTAKDGFVFIVDHHDIQLATLEGFNKYSNQALALGRTPRRILDITSKRLLLLASVGDGFPFAESTLQLIDPDRASHDPGSEKQHIVAEFSLKQGEAVYCLTEWKIPRPNKSDAVYICIGTGLFSPTGTEVSAAAPKTGRLVVLSVKQSRKTDRKFRKFELDLRWAMAMPAPVFAISTFMEMKLLISNGPVLKLLALDLEKKTLVEKASHRERWPIVQISNHGSMICTGSRRESICFYEYQSGIGGERSHDRLRFLKSAKSTRMVSDCMAISPEFAVGVDSSGGIFGLGYSREDPGCQHTLVDRFSFHLGEVVNRIRIAKIWPADVRSLAGISLSQRTSDTETTDATVFLECDSWRPSSGQLSSWILLPWTMDSNIQPSSSTQLTQLTAQLSSQALIACSLIGSIFGFWSLNSQVYLILSSLQSILQTTYECRPVLGNLHDRYRSLSSPGSNTVDGDLLYQFLGLDHELQVQLVSKAVGLERIVDGWLLQTGMGTQEQIYLSSAPRSVSKDNTTIESGCLMHKQPGQNQGRCKATNVICHIVEYLHSLDWHQQ